MKKSKQFITQQINSCTNVNVCLNTLVYFNFEYPLFPCWYSQQSTWPLVKSVNISSMLLKVCRFTILYMLLHRSIINRFVSTFDDQCFIKVLILNHTHLYNFSFIIIQNFGFESIVAIRLNAYQPQDLQKYFHTTFTFSRKETSERNSPFLG